jgi:hypothetical protein
VIPAVHKRGTNVARLLGYLFGPGRHKEHEDPHLVAAWNGAGVLADLEPPIRGDGLRDLRRLADLLNQPVRAGLKSPPQTVWHTSIRTHPTDRVLSDQQWGHIAAEVMHAVGLAPHGDTRAVRWLTVRHAPDHIHLVATLVRQDRRTAWAWKDKLKTQRICRELEQRYNLYHVAPPGQGSRTWPTPAELNKTTRLHRAPSGKPGGSQRRPVAPREQLRRQVRTVAAAVTTEADFFARLRQAGVKIRLRYSSRDPGQVTGYAVGMHGHVTAGGQTVWYTAASSPPTSPCRSCTPGGAINQNQIRVALRHSWPLNRSRPSAYGSGPSSSPGTRQPPCAPPQIQPKPPASPKLPPICSPPPPANGKATGVVH